MSAGRQAFKLTETARLIRAATLAGLTVRRVTMDGDGRPVLITEPAEVVDGEQKNPLDRVLEDASHENGAS